MSENNEEIAKKKILKHVLLAVLALLPLSIALIAFVLGRGSLNFFENNVYQIVLYDKDGDVIASESEDPDRADSGSLVSIFHHMTNNLNEEVQLPEAYAEMPSVSATVNYMNSREDYAFYFSFAEEGSYCVSQSGKAYVIDEVSVYRFLSSEFSRSLYSGSVPIKMGNVRGDIIEPSYIEWNYQTVAGEYLSISDAPVVDEKRSYYMSEKIELIFEEMPDVCTVTVYQNGEAVFSGNYSELHQLSLKTKEDLSIDVSAQWRSESKRGFFGKIEYSFDIILADRSDFHINGEKFYLSSFCVLSCTNVSDAANIVFESEPFLPIQPRFIKCGSDAVALLPFPADADAGEYTLTISYGTFCETFSLTVFEASEGNSTELGDFSEYADALSIQARHDLDVIRKYVAENSLDEKLFDGAFLSYTANGLLIGASYGDKYTFKNSDIEQSVIGNEYISSSDNVVAIGSGRVIKTGYNAYLGNYVIVSHGCGLSTWYAHLSGIDVVAGDIVVRGQLVGRSGSTGLSKGRGVLLITTVGEEFVDPEYVCGKEIE